MRTPFVAVVTLVIAGCAMPMQFAERGDNAYWMSKFSEGCVLGTEAGLSRDLWMEAVRFCSARKESPEKISTDFEIGIPYIRCARADLEFRCTPRRSQTAQP